MATFSVEYRVKGYALADAFRPDPMWGRKVFTVDGDKIGSNDPAEISKVARETAPAGYEFNKVMEVK